MITPVPVTTLLVNVNSVSGDGLVEQPGTLPQHERVDQQRVPVHQSGGLQRPDEGGAAHHGQVRSVARLELGDGPGRVTGQQHRVLPRVGILQGGGDHVLARRVQVGGEGVAVVGIRPGADEVLPGPPTEEHVAGSAHPLAHLPQHHVVGVARPPAAMAEAAAGVLIGSAEPLDHAVQSHAHGHAEGAHRGSSTVGRRAAAQSFDPTSARNHRAAVTSGRGSRRGSGGRRCPRRQPGTRCPAPVAHRRPRSPAPGRPIGRRG